MLLAKKHAHKCRDSYEQDSSVPRGGETHSIMLWGLKYTYIIYIYIHKKFVIVAYVLVQYYRYR